MNGRIKLANPYLLKTATRAGRGRDSAEMMQVMMSTTSDGILNGRRARTSERGECLAGK